MEQTERKKRALSCIQPTGVPTLGNYLGAGLAIKNGSKIVRPTVIVVLILLTLKICSELLFPEFWS